MAGRRTRCCLVRIQHGSLLDTYANGFARGERLVAMYDERPLLTVSRRLIDMFQTTKALSADGRSGSGVGRRRSWRCIDRSILHIFVRILKTTPTNPPSSSSPHHQHHHLAAVGAAQAAHHSNPSPQTHSSNHYPHSRSSSQHH